MVGRAGQMKDSSSVALISAPPGLLLLHATNHNTSARSTPTHPLHINPPEAFHFTETALSEAHFVDCLSDPGCNSLTLV
ncbi:uncharacterized [Tachysurus ichikawai]